MAPTPTQSLSNEDVVSKIQANPSFTYGGGGAGAGAGAPKQTPVDTRPQYSTPGQGVWPGLIAAVLMAIAVGLCVHSAWTAWHDHRAQQRAHAQELAVLRRTGESEKLRGGGGGSGGRDSMPSHMRDPAWRHMGEGGDVDGLRQLNGSGSVGVLSAPSATSPPVTIDQSARQFRHGLV